MEEAKVFLARNDRVVYGLQQPTPVEIVCGDCSGRLDEEGNVDVLPVRTLLALGGYCYTCGGRSFVIASELCGALRRTITARREHAVNQSSSSISSTPQQAA